LYQDSDDDDEHEETQEEFLERYAKAAIDLEEGSAIEEGDVENEDLEPDLGKVLCSTCKLCEKNRGFSYKLNLLEMFCNLIV